MNASRIGMFLLFVSLAACDIEGCLTGQTITVIYRGSATIDAQGQVIKDDRSIGRIESAEPHEEGQRLLLRITMFESLHENDRLQPYLDLDEVMGLRVEHHGGEALRSGDIFYYPPRAESQVASTRLPEISERGQERRRRDPLPGAAYVEPVELQPEEIIPFKDDTHARRDIRQNLHRVAQTSGLPPTVQTQMQNLIEETRRRESDDQHVIRSVRKELPAIREALAATAREAHRNGDRSSAKQALEGVRQLHLLENRMGTLEQVANRR